MDVATKVLFAERCTNCGCSFGAHKGGEPFDLCPGHEGGMDWHNSPGTKFKGSGDFTPVKRGTPAKRTL